MMVQRLVGRSRIFTLLCHLRRSVLPSSAADFRGFLSFVHSSVFLHTELPQILKFSKGTCSNLYDFYRAPFPQAHKPARLD